MTHSETNSLSESVSEEPILFFEGPEKTLEVEFQGAESLRSAGRAAWDRVVAKAAASILHEISNDYFDSYILSESSLFVMRDKVIIKTCGTTTLLHALPEIKDVGHSLGMELGFTTFTRKDLQEPDQQHPVHRSFTDEMDFFAKFFHTKGETAGQLLGSVTSDHWHLCTSPSLPLSLISHPHEVTSCTTNIMMYGLSAHAARKFVKSDEHPTGVAMTDKSGIRALMPSQTKIHEWAFDPCGYSMNALCDEYYATAHVTPESSCSYASFETTLSPWKDNDVSRVLDVFEPTRFTITRLSHLKCGCGHCDFPTIIMNGSGRIYHRIVFQQTNVASREYAMANYRCDTLVNCS